MGGNLSELRKIVNFCRKNGIYKYRSADFEVSIARSALKLPKQRSKKVEIPIAGLPDNGPQNPSNMDLLLWSSTPEGIEQI